MEIVPVILVVVGAIIGAGLIAPHTRPFVLGLLLVGGLVVLLASFLWVLRGDAPEPPPSHIRGTAGRLARPERAAVPPPPPMPPAPRENEAREPRPRGLLAALGNALLHGLADGKKPPQTPEAAAEKDATADAPREAAKPQSERPEWVDAAPKLEGDTYWMTLHVGPYTTPVECQAELPKDVFAAAAEYASLSMGIPGASKKITLSDEELKALVRQQWTETRPWAIDGGTQPMTTLHVLVAFDPAMQVRIRDAVEQEHVAQRLLATGAVLGSVLGALAVAWGALRLVEKR